MPDFKAIAHVNRATGDDVSVGGAQKFISDEHPGQDSAQQLNAGADTNLTENQTFKPSDLDSFNPMV